MRETGARSHGPPHTPHTVAPCRDAAGVMQWVWSVWGQARCREQRCAGAEVCRSTGRGPGLPLVELRMWSVLGWFSKAVSARSVPCPPLCRVFRKFSRETSGQGMGNRFFCILHVLPPSLEGEAVGISQISPCLLRLPCREGAAEPFLVWLLGGQKGPVCFSPLHSEHFQTLEQFTCGF